MNAKERERKREKGDWMLKKKNTQKKKRKGIAARAAATWGRRKSVWVVVQERVYSESALKSIFLPYQHLYTL